MGKRKRSARGLSRMSKGLTRDKIVSDITSERGYRRAIRYRGLTVMEVYTSTWGPCQCVFQKLQSIYKDFMDRPVKLVCAECDEIPALADFKGRSMPIFLLYKKGQLIETIEGVNTPVLERQVQDNAPSKDELAAGQDDPDSADDEDPQGGATQGGGKRRASLSVGLGRRRSVVK